MGILRHHERHDDRHPATTRDPEPPPMRPNQPVPPIRRDPGAVVDDTMRRLPPRRVLTRAEAHGVLTSLAEELADSSYANDVLFIVMGAIDAIDGEALVDRHVVDDALLDVRLLTTAPAIEPVVDVAEILESLEKI